ncbi:hypothetical protein DFH06DRAFT_1229624 [Mycena polygramma]|nr:hypothetical protein DFH06DRAFT_1229624 [Mycena polygramma]
MSGAMMSTTLIVANAFGVIALLSVAVQSLWQRHRDSRATISPVSIPDSLSTTSTQAPARGRKRKRNRRARTRAADRDSEADSTSETNPAALSLEARVDKLERQMAEIQGLSAEVEGQVDGILRCLGVEPVYSRKLEGR